MLNLPLKTDPKDGSVVYVDQRELVLRYEIPVGDIKPFFDGLAESKVLAAKCPKCSKLYFPPQNDCPRCHVTGMEWVPLSTDGKLLAATMIFVKPKSFESEAYYLVAIARLNEGVNVLAWLKTDDPTKVRIGMPVKLTVTTNSKGNAVYGFTAV